jgi:DNA-binding MarR family transcriptional regulator
MFYLNVANHAVRSRLEEALRHLEVTGIQYTVLSVVGAHEGLSSAELSRRFYVTPQTMNELINGLERRKLIARREDPANRRILKMRLTPLGRRLVVECDAVADRVEADVFGALPRESYRQLRALTRMLARELREHDESPAAGAAESPLRATAAR